MDWFKNLIDSLERLLDKPPYLIFVFIGTLFVVITLLWGNRFEQAWVFFIYAVAGTVWRYIERDFVGALQRDHDTQKGIDDKNKKIHWDRSGKLWIAIIVYHLGNLGLLIALFRYLHFI